MHGDIVRLKAEKQVCRAVECNEASAVSTTTNVTVNNVRNSKPSRPSVSDMVTTMILSAYRESIL
jgi:hypothetical protein